MGLGLGFFVVVFLGERCIPAGVCALLSHLWMDGETWQLKVSPQSDQLPPKTLKERIYV